MIRILGRLRADFAGHVHTVAPVVRHALVPQGHGGELRAAPWSTEIVDPVRGRVRLTGKLHDAGGETLVVVVHGLGGHVDSHYVHNAALTLARGGLSSLRVNLRGADRRGDDFYHAGIIEDLGAVLASPDVARFSRVILWGSSLGGHLSLRFAALTPDPRLSGVVAVCPPLDLAAGASAIDTFHRRPYLRHVLAGLVEMYEQVAARGPVPLPVADAHRIRSIRTWDERIVARRFGFRGAADYYARMSVAPHLGAIQCPTLLVVGDSDPMVPRATVEPALRGVSSAVDVRVVDGGHVGFPRHVDLGQRGPRGLEPQVAAWIAARA